MKNTLGTSLRVTLFGESHGEAIGAILDGAPAGIKVDLRFINNLLTLRRPVGTISTARKEQDEFKIVSGVFEGFTTGAPICILIPNKDTKSKDYDNLKDLVRPSHADFTASVKYKGFEDKRGGGHFSGRLTAALVAAAGIVIPALQKKGIFVGTHLSRCAGVDDRNFDNLEQDIKALSSLSFAALDEEKGAKMQENIKKAAADNDSVGGILETAVIGLPAGVGEPWFSSVEGVLANAMFSIPGIKGVEFGTGFSICDMLGSAANDPFEIKDGKVVTTTNNSGGINGGITNGMPIIFRCAVKPTPTISKPQQTVNINTNTNETLVATGRHDPCIAHRMRVVVDAVTALILCDMLTLKFGTDWLV